MTPEAELLAETHLTLVYAIARECRKQMAGDLDDLIGDGMLGLIQAAERYEPTHGTTFRQYAKTRIRGAVIDGHRYRTGYNHTSGTAPQRLIRLDGVSNDDDLFEAVPGGMSAEDLVVAILEVRRVVSMIDGLNDKQRAVAWDAIHGVRQNVTARRFGVTDTRVSQILREVRQRVRNIAAA